MGPLQKANQGPLWANWLQKGCTNLWLKSAGGDLIWRSDCCSCIRMKNKLGRKGQQDTEKNSVPTKSQTKQHSAFFIRDVRTFPLFWLPLSHFKVTDLRTKPWAGQGFQALSLSGNYSTPCEYLGLDLGSLETTKTRKKYGSIINILSS